MSASKTSAFHRWFISQHGKRPVGAIHDEKLAQQVQDGDRARATLQMARTWDYRYQSALYAWQARGKFKP